MQPSIDLLSNKLTTSSGACCLLTCFHIRLTLIFCHSNCPVCKGVFPLYCSIVTPNQYVHVCDLFQVAQSKLVLGIFTPAPTVVHAGNVQDIRINLLDMFQGSFDFI